MAGFSLKAEPRRGGRPRATRRSGYVPAILYGQDLSEPLPVRVGNPDVARLLSQHGGRGLLDLRVDGDKRTVMVKDLQRDPVRGDVLHIDFYHVSMTETLQTRVPVRLVGEEAASAKGGVLQHQLWEVDVSCLPGDIPEEFVLDASHLEPGSALTVGDIDPPEGVDIRSEADQVIASVVVPRKLEEELPAHEVEPGEEEEELEAPDGAEAEDEEAEEPEEPAG